MGSVDEESNHTYSDLESEPDTTDGPGVSLAYAALAFDEYDRFASDNRILSFTSCSSSISSDSSLEDSDLENEQEKSSLNVSDNVQLDQFATVPEKNINEQSNDPGSPTFSSGPPTSDPIYESPPVQVMERAPSSNYRIPSHAFERKKSTPVEWSMASNESLFSIHGNSSRKHDRPAVKSGELGTSYPPEASTSSAMSKPPLDNKSSGRKKTKGGKSSKWDKTRKAHKSGKGSNNQGSTMPYEPMTTDSKEDQRSTADQRSSHFSKESSSSKKSSVFPVLAGGETDKGNSPNPHGSPTRVPEQPTAQSTPMPAPTPATTPAPASEPEPEPEPTPEPPSKPEESESKVKTEKPPPNTSWNWTKWFPCCSCCTCCS